MNRSVKNLLDQQAASALPQVKKYHAKIESIEHPSHSFVVNVAGYGRMTVKAEPAIAFGSQQYPAVFRGNDCLIERNPSDGHFRATQYITTNKCVPTTGNNVPNVPLPSYAPAMPTFVLPPPISFPPISAPRIPPISLPPFTLPTYVPTTLSNVYSIGDGYPGLIAVSTTQSLIYFTTVDKFKIVLVTAFCDTPDVTIKVFATNGTYPNIVMNRNLAGQWSITIQNPTTGTAIVTYTTLSTSNTIVRALTGTGIVLVPTVGTLFRAEVITGASPIVGVAYGLRGVLYA